MKRLTVFIAAAFFTFLTGIAINWVYTSVSSLFFAEKSTTTNFIAEKGTTPKSRLAGDLEVTFIGLNDDVSGKYAQFEVTNGDSETAYYVGYGKESHCSELVRQGRKVELPNFCWCGTGLAEQSLRHGESVILNAHIPNPNEAFEVGFDFSFGEKRTKKTIWSSRIEPWVDR